MDVVLAWLEVLFQALPFFTAIGLVVLWSRLRRSGLDGLRHELWGVQHAGAALEHRVVALEHRVVALEALRVAAAAGVAPAAAPELDARAWGATAPMGSGETPHPAAAALEERSIRLERSPERTFSDAAETPTWARAAPPGMPRSSPSLAPVSSRETTSAPVTPSLAPVSSRETTSAPVTPSLAPVSSRETTSAPVTPSVAEGEPASRPAPRPTISLEQWLGVRGAAALGAAVLVLAGIYFFKYSIDHELLSYPLRVVIGAITGAAATAGAELWLRKKHALLASCVTGAGLAIFYLTFWAAFARYELIGAPLAAALMIAVTASSCALAMVRSSLAIAALGLVGGFATPALLSSGSDRPLTLFGYLLVLDVALLFVAHRRRWPSLALLGLVGTSGYQALWIAGRMGPAQLGFGTMLCVVFGALFAVAGERRERTKDRDPLWRNTRAAAVLLPMGFAAYASVTPSLHASFTDVALLLLGLLAGAGAVAHRERWSGLTVATLVAALTVLGLWLEGHGVADAWLVGGFVVVVAVGLQVATAVTRVGASVASATPGSSRGGTATGSVSQPDVAFASATPLWLAGAFAVTIGAVAYAPAVAPWPWMLTWLALALSALRDGSLPGREPVMVGGAAALGLGLCLLAAHTLPHADGANGEHFIGGVLLLLVAHQVATLSLSYPRPRAVAGHAAALLPVMMLVALPGAVAMRPWLYVLAVLFLVALCAFATLRHGASAWLLVAASLGGMALWWVGLHLDVTDPIAQIDRVARGAAPSAPGAGPTDTAHAIALVGYGALALGLLAWPLLANRRVRERASAWRNAALGPALMFFPMVALTDRFFGSLATAVLALALGAATLAALYLARALERVSPTELPVANAWLGGATLGFAAMAFPLALEHEWLILGWALFGTALLVLWRRVEHEGLRYVALASSGVVCARLLMVTELLDFRPTVGLPVLNWVTYTYLVPVACFVINVALLHGRERSRLRPFEPVTASGEPVSPLFFGAAAIVLGFVWLNITIFDVFGGAQSLASNLTHELAHVPARDLTMSLCWALYGLALLAGGVWRGSGALRKASLALLLITCGKVFLLDLSHLEDLQRVMSLTGLALSLIVVSFAYHRFVLRRDEDRS